MLTPLEYQQLAQSEQTRQKDLLYFDYIKQIELAAKQGRFTVDINLPINLWTGFKQYLISNEFTVTDKLINNQRAAITVSWQETA
jgi:hypothetical protein